MPLTNPSDPRGPCRFVDREFFIIACPAAAHALRAAIPQPRAFTEAPARYGFHRTPDSTGFGDYTEPGQVIRVSLYAQAGGHVHAMYRNDDAPVAGGREIRGLPKKLAEPSLSVAKDSLLGTLDYGPVRIATGTVACKHHALALDALTTTLEAPGFVLEIIPDVDREPRVCELVRYYLTDINVKGARSGPAAPALHAHVSAPVADPPLLEAVSGVHIISDLTLGPGEVVRDYLQD